MAAAWNQSEAAQHEGHSTVAPARAFRAASASAVVSAVREHKIHADSLLAFKASVDELARLCAGRAEDELLLQQLAQRLKGVDPTVAGRLLNECRFREEWRDTKSGHALSSMPAAAHDPNSIDRMREYVSMLAPRTATVESAHQQPWQRELLRQQQALASVLQLCPSHSPDRVLHMLGQFMNNSRARLHEQLYLAECAVTSMGAERSSSTDGLRAGPARPAPSHAPTAEAFLAQLMGQRRAVCNLQAFVRMRSRRRWFLSKLQQRKDAGLRLQCGARRMRAVRKLQALRHAELQQRRRSLTEHYAARRLQRAWRWRCRVARWRPLWRMRVREMEEKADREWRHRLKCSLAPRPPSPTGFSAFSEYIESARLKEERERKEGAAACMQRVCRGGIARREARVRHGAVCALQGAARGWHARTRLLWWQRRLRPLRRKRALRLQWQALRAQTRALVPIQNHVVTAQLHVSKEVESVQSGALQERSEYEAAFRKWAIKMHKQTLAKKMHKDWIPQMNVSTGKTYFFNLKTGESSEEHPNVEVGRATERKQRGIADKAIEKRLAKLRDYEATLLQALRDQMAQAEQILAQQIADHMDAWRGAVCYPFHFVVGLEVQPSSLCKYAG